MNSLKWVIYTALYIFLFSILSCSNYKDDAYFFENFDAADRVWIGKDFWSIPLEDWRIQNSRVECVGKRKNMRINVLTRIIEQGKGTINVSVKMGLLEQGKRTSAGIRLGSWDDEDQDVRSLCYFGKGLEIGITSDGSLFLGNITSALPENFNMNDFVLNVSASPSGDNFGIKTTATDNNGKTATIDREDIESPRGLIVLFNTHPETEADSLAHFWFDDLKISGSKIQNVPTNAFGPILWSMYTLSRGVVKMTVQMPPIGLDDNQTVLLQLKKEKWQTVAEAKIDQKAYITSFKMEGWQADKDIVYRLVYKDKINEESFYTGTIRKDPVDRPLVLGGLTCQYGTGFPYSPLVKNLTAHNPDMLYFSGDQIYEGNGGYSIIRFPAKDAITNYLGKWYMFGWAFGDLMRDRPTICTPDDHDVFQGNLWGEGGINNPMDRWQRLKDSSGGYVQPAEMVQVVHDTQCSHLPDPYDPTPMEQNLRSWYTDMVYGRISFAIVSDRMFKTGPQTVAWWEGRADHLKEPLPDPSALDRPDLQFLGDRQMDFLQNWICDWRNADMKVLLSQTIFMNAATHHGGEQMELAADLDSGGWPQTARNKALDLMRKAFVFHIAGDQHVPSLGQYGIDNFRDAGWAFCTPAIFVGYERRFLPHKVGINIKNPPVHNLPNTGEFFDGFGNPNYIYAIGNPVDEPRWAPRYGQGEDRSSGYGIIRFNQQERTITVEAWRFAFDMENPSLEDQFPGWPLAIHQMDNYGRKPLAYLPEIEVSGVENPVIEVTDQKTNVLEYIVRIKGTFFHPMVFSTDSYKVKIGEPERDRWKVLEGLQPSLKSDAVLKIQL